MPSKRIGEESHLSISRRGGSMSSISILRFGCLFIHHFCTFSWDLQIDKDRAVAAGASYGGYAIKYVFASIPRNRDWRCF